MGVLVTILFYLNRVTVYHHPFWEACMATMLYAFFIWELNEFLMLTIRGMYPTFEQTKKRALIQVAIYPFTSLLIILILTGFFDLTRWWGFDYEFRHYIFDYSVTLIFTLMGAAVYEGFYIFDKWRVTTLETEQLKRENLQSQFESLKNQVNPHFLFNSLNSLSSLIEEDEKKAGIFIEELSRVYRYLLKSNEWELTTLKAELEFIHSYFYLLSTRYGDNVRLHVSVSPFCEKLQIPPLTLQLLVENAVKHNVISRNRPLDIRIYNESAWRLVVSNTLQRKDTKVLSNKVGLTNIISKYRLLGQQEPQIEENNTTFRVVLPLINADQTTIHA